MRRVLDMKLYDTERAEQIARCAPPTGRDDREYMVETLYRTADGEYFVHTEDDGFTIAALRAEVAPKRDVRVRSEAEALDWCEVEGLTRTSSLTNSSTCWSCSAERRVCELPRSSTDGAGGRRNCGSSPQRGFMGTNQTVADLYERIPDAAETVMEDEYLLSGVYRRRDGTVYCGGVVDCPDCGSPRGSHPPSRGGEVRGVSRVRVLLGVNTSRKIVSQLE